MGQQQLLLIVLGVIIVGIAVILGIVLFRANSIDGKRDLLINEGMTVANNAREYFHNGSYTATINPDNVEIIGTGNELVSGTDLVEVRFIVTSDSVETIIVH